MHIDAATFVGTLEFECTAARRRSGTGKAQRVRFVGTHCQGSRSRCTGLERVRRHGSSWGTTGHESFGHSIGTSILCGGLFAGEGPTDILGADPSGARFAIRMVVVGALRFSESELSSASCHTGVVANYPRSHDDGMWSCFCRMMRIDTTQEEDIRSAAGMPLILGGLGLRSAVRLSRSAFWASWADCLPMVLSRHHEVAVRFVVNLEGAPDTQSLGAAAAAMWSLRGTMGFEPPSWRALAEGARPGPVEPEDIEPGSVRRGWQHEASSHVDRHFREHVQFDRLPPRDRAQMRSQAGPGAQR